MQNAIATLPKVELQLHIEGSPEPELMLELAARNGVSLPWTLISTSSSAWPETPCGPPSSTPNAGTIS